MALCPLAATMTLACGGGDEFGDDPMALDADAESRIDRVELTRLALVSEDGPSMLHPVRVEVELDVTGSAFETDVQVGLTAADGELGCVLGAFRVSQDEEGTSHFTLDNELVVRSGCADLVGRDDVALYAALDPWGQLEYERQGTAADEPMNIYDLARGSMLDTTRCEGCDVTTSLADSPGLDAQLREVSLDSSVAVLSLPAAPDQTQMPADDTPHFSISSASRIVGLARGQAPAEGESFMTYRIRPLAGAPGTAGLDGGSLGWAPLLEGRESDDGRAYYLDRTPVELRGQTAHQQASAVYIGEEVAARMAAGDWREVEEFELQTCVSGDYAQAVYQGETAPRDNDCAVLPVVVVREHVAADGSRGVEAGDALAGGGKARTAKTWGTGWQTTNNFIGTNYTNGIDFEAWIDVNASDEATATYRGVPVNGAGSWFEAGAGSTAIVFNNDITLLDAYVTAIGLNDDPGGSGIEAKVEAMGQSFFDTGGFVSASDGVELTLEQILQMANKPTNTLWSQSKLLVGYSFDDGCATVSAGISLVGEIGLDNQATRFNINSVPSGVQLSGTIAPTAALIAESKAEAGYDGFLSINVALTMAIDIIRIILPFTSSATATAGSPSSLSVDHTGELEMSSLSGSITFDFSYEFWCPAFWDDWTCTGDHSHTLASWSGISKTWTLFDITQGFQFGPGIAPDSDSFCDLYDGQSVRLYTHHDKYVRANSSAEGYTVDQSDIAVTWETFGVQCQPGDKVAFHTYHGRYLQAWNADQGWTVKQQTFPGPWEQFTAIPQADGTWAFQTEHGRYLQALSDGGMNQQTFVGPWEQFDVQSL